ncbi:MAG TPA: heavy metal translocating P-type ATPase [Gaiellaceae bacterium]|nr:heavy metal translocating P-type ATPase [Gaiellaceae bacterium]
MTDFLLALQALAGLAAGAVLHLFGIDGPAHAVWAVSTAVILVPLTLTVTRSLLRRDVGVDAIALVAIATALVLGEYLAGAVVALMLAGGNALEEYASGRARRELRTLVERAPRTALRRRDDTVEEVPVDAVRPGDVVVVRAGELVPVDGHVLGHEAVVDEAAITGEPLPRTIAAGEPVRSGVANAADAFEVRAARPAAESTYAALVRLMREAEAQRAPFERLADRYAAVFLPVTLVVASVAWAASGDPVRALAVLVVATPCPLILAAPIALVAGVSRAAHAGIVVKGAAAIEKLGEARTALLDKTGTLTVGVPELEAVAVLDGHGESELLRLAASVDRLSAHPLAEALVRAAAARGLDTAFPVDVEEAFGRGVEGRVDGRRVAVGSASWLAERGYGDGSVPEVAGHARVLVGVDGALAGMILLADHLRADAADAVAALREAGIEHVALVTGDKAAVGEEIGRVLGVDRVYAEQTPAEKLEVVRAAQARPELRPVLMAGDGVNDAPALALADVGVALGTAGATIASEAADAVIVVDRIDRLAEAVRIGRRSMKIARQSVLAGLGLSLAAMVVAAFGYLPPVFGALLQEGIDVAVILNALRALR